MKDFRQILLLMAILSLLTTILGFLFPFRTKIQSYVGFPVAFYGYGIFPWLGDLETKTIFSFPKLLIDILFWFTISVILHRLYGLVFKKKRKIAT